MIFVSDVPNAHKNARQMLFFSNRIRSMKSSRIFASNAMHAGKYARQMPLMLFELKVTGLHL